MCIGRCSEMYTFICWFVSVCSHALVLLLSLPCALLLLPLTTLSDHFPCTSGKGGRVKVMVTLTVSEGIRRLSYGGVPCRFSSGLPLLSARPIAAPQECAMLFRDVTRPPPLSLCRVRGSSNGSVKIRGMKLVKGNGKY